MTTKKTYLMFISRIAIIVGVLLITIVIAIEAYNYPWGTIFSFKQAYTDMHEPAPIAFKGQDANSILVEKASTNSDNSTDNIEFDNTLPGNTKENTYIPSYLKLGVIKIPQIKLAQHVLEGTNRQLEYGVGHILGTADLGAEGNCVLTGHNSSFFRYLNKLSIDDLIYLETVSTRYTYKLYDSFIVKPTETWVLDDIDSEISTLTLITCTSYSLETNRLILRARLVETNDR